MRHGKYRGDIRKRPERSDRSRIAEIKAAVRQLRHIGKAVKSVQRLKDRAVGKQGSDVLRASAVKQLVYVVYRRIDVGRRLRRVGAVGGDQILLDYVDDVVLFYYFVQGQDRSGDETVQKRY